MKQTKAILGFLLVMAMLLNMTGALALTSAEKEMYYSTAFMQLEAYLEEVEEDAERNKIEELQNIIDTLDDLGNYSYSQPLKFYVMALQKIELGEFDFMLDVYFQSMEKNSRFIDYLKGMQDSPIFTVEEFKYYMAGRKAESEGNTEEAIVAYDLCNGFYDSYNRVYNLNSGVVEDLYQQGIELLSEGDIEGAYVLLNGARGYKDADMYLAVIEDLIQTDDVKTETAQTGEQTPVKTAEWSEWVTELPEGVDESAYEIETQTLYRTADREYKTAAATELEGYTLIAQQAADASYGAWSEWTASPIQETKTRQVQSTEMYRYRTLETTTSTSSSMSGWTKYDSKTTNGNYGSWSDWSTTAASQSNTRQVESKEMYRYRTLETTTSTSSSMSGWTLYDSKMTNGDYGAWSDWSVTAASSSDTRQVETKTQYRARSLNYTTSTSSSMSGWNLVDSSVSYGAWSDWSTKEPTGSSIEVDTRFVDAESTYDLAHYCTGNITGAKYLTASGSNTTNSVFNANCTYHYLGTYTKAELDRMETSGSGGYKGPRCANTCYTYYQVAVNVNFEKQYRYRTKTTTYRFSQYGSWSAWSDSTVSGDQTESRTVYRFRDRTQGMIYYFKRWGSWSQYSDTKAAATSEREVESAVFYRFRDRTQTTTYYFKRWGSWSQYNSNPVSATSEREVESLVFYRSRDLLSAGENTFWRWGEWSEWTSSPAEANDDRQVESRVQYRYKAK